MRRMICKKMGMAQGESNMFRQEEVFIGGWQEKTMEAMLRRRFENSVNQLPPLGAGRLESLSPDALTRKLERSWQHV